MCCDVSSRYGVLSGRGVCLDEALHLDDSGVSLLDVAEVHLERSRKWRLHLDVSGGLFECFWPPRARTSGCIWIMSKGQGVHIWMHLHETLKLRARTHTGI